MKPLSLTARISLLFAGVAVIVLLGIGWVLTMAVEAHFKGEDTAEIQGKFELIAHLLGKAHDQDTFDALAQELDDALVGHAGLSVIVINDQGAIWYASSGAPFPRTLLQGDAARQKKMAQWEQDKRSYYGQIVTLPVGREAKPYQVAISLDITHHRVFMDEFHRLLALSMVLAVLGTTGLGWVATRRGLKPLHEVTGMVSTLSASKLTERLPATRIPHELHDLVFAFNAMLGRLEESFLRLSHFSSDIAHELRTPISNLMTQTQVVLTKARDAGEYREILYSNLEEYQRLAAMIADMLFLAKADNGLIIPSRAPVDLAAEARDLFTYYEALAEEQGVALAENGEGSVSGDRLMLRRALSNLLSNAIRHTPRGGTVSVSIAPAENGIVTVTVENPGTPIPAEHLPRIFDRFYRIDPSRQRTSEGAGLGLAITQSIVQAHGGLARVFSDKTTRFELELPAS